jgi:hypothetical protein
VEHVQYWLNHSLPVVVVLYHPKAKQCHWQLVNKENAGGDAYRWLATGVVDQFRDEVSG